MAAPASRTLRNSVILYAAVVREGKATAECRVRNLSTMGACVDNNADLVVDERMTVDMGTLRAIPGEVMWVERGFAGLRFAIPVDLAAARRPRSQRAPVISAGWVDSRAHAYRRTP